MSKPLTDTVNIIGSMNKTSNSQDPTTQNASTIVIETGISMVVFYLLFKSLSHYLTDPAFMNKWKISKALALDTANKLISAFFAILSSSTGVFVLVTYGGDYYIQSAITYFMPLSMGYFLYDFFAMAEVYFQKLNENPNASDKTKSIRAFAATHPLMSIHHLALSLFFVPLMVNRRDHYPGDPMLACALIMEASTPFVSLRAILHNLNLRQSLAYLLNGVLMVIVFFCCRILIYPWFYMVHSRATSMTILEAVMMTPPRCATWMVLALIPQIYWFKIMLYGALKVVKEKFVKTSHPNNNSLSPKSATNDTKKVM